MKYKVSLLPEVRKKRIIGKQKVEKFRSVAITAFIVLLALFLLVFISKLYADSKLKALVKNNKEYEKKVESLAKYREINADIESKVKLVKAIEVEEPYVYQFVIALGNIDEPGVTITGVDCADWKTTRQCTVTGTCNKRSEYISFKAALEKLEYVSSVSDVEYVSGLGTEEGTSSFTVAITAKGGKEAVDLSMDEAGLLEVSTTVLDENGGAEG